MAWDGEGRGWCVVGRRSEERTDCAIQRIVASLISSRIVC